MHEMAVRCYFFFLQGDGSSTLLRVEEEEIPGKNTTECFKTFIFVIFT